MQRSMTTHMVLGVMVCGLMGSVVATCSAQVSGEALLGEPYGVARLSIPIQGTELASSVAVEDADGRLLYPALRSGPVAQLLSGLLGADPAAMPGMMQVSFLFTGSAPLEVTVYTPAPRRFVLKPTTRPQRLYDRALQRWWRDYHAVAREQEQVGDYPPLVHTYLTTMLSQRLRLSPPLLSRVPESSDSELQDTMQLVFGAEKLRRAILRDTLLGVGLSEVADRDLPAPIAWQPLELAPAPRDVEIEPIAFHVPRECFYVRFGNFTNYLWLSGLLKDHGGDIGQMVKLRGHSAALNKKLEDQLALKQSALAEILGPQVIADVAILGRDMYLKEGAAMGVLFHARNNLALSADFTQQRAAALAAHRQRGASLQTVAIGGHDVSFLSTPDNRLRSFYAVDGDFHLVTTSRTIVERFYEAGQGEGALGAAAEFQHARAEMPLAREDTIFAYHSSAFFAHLLSPRYQIELTRRLQAVADTEMLQLARLAAANEGFADQSIQALIEGGFLPRGFGRRADGGGPVVAAGVASNTIRGERGYFTPIPDVPLEKVTAGELAQYTNRAAYYQEQWRQMDPLVSAVKRFKLDDNGLERVVIDANVSPLVEEKYGWLLSILGEPSDVEIASDPSDLVTIQAVLRGGLLDSRVAPHHLFVGVRDADFHVPPSQSGVFQTLRLLQATPGYLGAWPKLGFLDLLPVLAGQPDAGGFSPLPLGAWRWQGDDFSVVSFDRRVLEDATPHLRPVRAETPAQLRVRIGDLAGSRLADGLTELNYQRSAQTSRGNLRLLQAISQQFQVPAEAARSEAETLLDAKLVCTLGGDYQLVDDGGRRVWQSTAIEAAAGSVPDDYRAPLLQWFRGAHVDVVKRPGRLDLHAEIDMQREKRANGIQLPSFDLFGLGKKKPAPAVEKEAAGEHGADRDEPLVPKAPADRSDRGER